MNLTPLPDSDTSELFLVESGTGQKTTEEERNKDQHMCQALLDVVSAHG